MDIQASIIISILSLSFICAVYLIVRMQIAHDYAMYWIDEVSKYHYHCINTNRDYDVDYEDILDTAEYVRRWFDFKRDNMIPDTEKLKTLYKYKNKLRQGDTT
jgi:hypothetical protein